MVVDFKCSTLKIQGSNDLKTMENLVFHFSVSDFHLIKPSLTKHVLLVWLGYRTLSISSHFQETGTLRHIYAESGATPLVGVFWRENKNKLVEWKALIDTVGIKS